MSKILYRSLLIFSLLILVELPNVAWSQSNESQTFENATVGPNMPPQDLMTWAGIVIVNGDTLPHWYLKEFDVVASYLDKNKSAQLAKLKYNVLKVYPYAVEASRIINQIDIELKKTDKRRDQKKYLKALEDQLNAQFKDKLKNLTTTQGAILVKLINRQSGRDVYSVIKDLKGGLTARVSQTAFYFYDNDLKAQYDPYNKDKDIEKIVRDIEEKAYYNYQIQNTRIIQMSDVKK